MGLRDFGKSGFKFSPVGMGTWDMEGVPQASIAALRKGIEAGSNHIDTAEMYGSGFVEELVGEAVKGLRDKVHIVSKVMPQNASYEGTLYACEQSLKRLKTDFLDCYLLHWRTQRVDLEETFRAFMRLKEQGKIKSFGVSNFDVKDMEEALSIAGEGNIACNQVLYHLNERSVEARLIPFCEKKKIAIVAYSPLGQGHLPRSQTLEIVVERHHASPAQIALAFLLRRPSVIVIPKSSNMDRVQENIRAGGIELSKEEIGHIERNFPLRARRRLPMV